MGKFEWFWLCFVHQVREIELKIWNQSRILFKNVPSILCNQFSVWFSSVYQRSAGLAEHSHNKWVSKLVRVAHTAFLSWSGTKVVCSPSPEEQIKDTLRCFLHRVPHVVTNASSLTVKINADSNQTRFWVFHFDLSVWERGGYFRTKHLLKRLVLPQNEREREREREREPHWVTRTVDGMGWERYTYEGLLCCKLKCTM